MIKKLQPALEETSDPLALPGENSKKSFADYKKAAHDLRPEPHEEPRAELEDSADLQIIPSSQGNF